MKKSRRAKIVKIFLCTVILVSMLMTMETVVLADSGKSIVPGKVYEFDKKSAYEFSSSTDGKQSTTDNTYGEFSVAGTIGEVFTKNSVPAYRVDGGNLKLTYAYGDTMLNAGENDWHLVEDKSKKIDTISLDGKILKGALVVQTSVDQKNWITVSSATNVFAATPVNAASFYTTQEVQLCNGCFYRVIAAYELTRRTEESNFLFINTDEYEYKKMAEVYTFYACDLSVIQKEDPSPKYNLGSVTKTAHFNGYFGEKPIEEGDPHYGITLGQFSVDGYTDTATDEENNIVFLKNVGDKVTLWFNLNENINAIGGNEKIKVTADGKGYDQHFQTSPTNFGRGALIIRYTDYNNIASKPQIYTNYLEANTSVGADTKVSLFEEGDYEVALDYELTEDRIVDFQGHYRIFLKFSVRNGNCMVYPIDLKTQSELTNSSIAENGFKLNLAKSRYLKVAVKREILAESADGLVEDTRFNAPAKDGGEYKEEGIYTIMASNQYTKQATTKKIYVGTNATLRAHMTTGLPIPEINKLIANGATVNADGTIVSSSSNEGVVMAPEMQGTKPAEQGANKNATKPLTWIIVVLLVAVACIVFFWLRKTNVISASPKSNGIGIDGGDEG